MSVFDNIRGLFPGAKFLDLRNRRDPLGNAAADPAKAPAAAPSGPLFVRSSQEDEVARFNRWRESFNPLRGLDIAKAVMHLEAGERGEYADLQWIYRLIEKRDAVLRGGKRNLLAAVGERDWDVRPIGNIPAGYTQAQVDKQVQDLRAAYERVDNLRAAIEWLGLAEFRGFSHLEKHFASGGENDGGVVHLEPVPQWYFGRDSQNSPWKFDKTAASGINRGVPIEPNNFIIREVEDPIDEIALIAFLRKNLSRKDWDGFIESYGIPSIFIELPASTNPEDADKYQEVAEKIIGDARGTIPSGGKVHALDSGSRGNNPFKEHLEALNEEIAMAITSGALTMLHASGTGTLAGGAHSDTFTRVANALCSRVDEALQEQFDKPFLTQHFPGEPVLAFFQLSGPDEDPTSYIAGLKALKQSGYSVDPAQVEEKTSYQLIATAAVAPVDTSKERLATAAPVVEGAAPGGFVPPAPNSPEANAATIPVFDRGISLKPAPPPPPAVTSANPKSEIANPKSVSPPANLSPEQWSGVLNTRAEVLNPVVEKLNHLIDLANDPSVTDVALQQAVDETAAAIPGAPINPDALAQSLEQFMTQGAADTLTTTQK